MAITENRATDAALPVGSPAVPEAIAERSSRWFGAQVVLLGAFLLDLLLYGLVVPFLPEQAATLGARPVMIGALFAAYAAGLFLATPVSAWLTNMIGARRTMLAGLLALFAATMFFAFAPDLLWLFIARAAQGVSAAVTWTAGLALIAQLYGPKERTRVFGRVFIATGIGTLLGPPLGGALYSLGGFRLPFLVASLLVLLDGLGRIIFIPGQKALQVERPNSGAIWGLMRHPLFLLGLLATLAGAAVLALLEPVLAPLLAIRFGASALDTGLFFAGASIIYIVAQPLVTFTTNQLGGRVTIIFGLAISALGIGLLAFAPALLHAVVAFGIIVFGVAFVLTPSLELLTAAGEQEKGQSGGGVPHGSIYAAYNLAWAGGVFLGPLLSGFAITELGLIVGLGATGLVALAPGLLMLKWRGA